MGNNHAEFRVTDSEREMAHLVIVQTVGDKGRVDSDITWCESADMANDIANHEAKEAVEGEYSANIYVLRAIKQCCVKDGVVDNG